MKDGGPKLGVRRGCYAVGIYQAQYGIGIDIVGQSIFIQVSIHTYHHTSKKNISNQFLQVNSKYKIQFTYKNCVKSACTASFREDYNIMFIIAIKHLVVMHDSSKKAHKKTTTTGQEKKTQLAFSTCRSRRSNGTL